MALFEGTAGSVVVGAVVGLAAAVLAPVILPVVATVGRPLLKGAIKGAIKAYGRGQEVVGELTETIEDMSVEVREEMRSHNGQRPASTGRARRAGASAPRKRSRRARAEETAAA